jgi:hypothetical protein
MSRSHALTNLLYRERDGMERHSLGTKEIEFKDFGMGQIRRALPGDLAPLNAVPGFLLTLAVHQKLVSLFGPQGKDTRELIARILSEVGVGERKTKVNEKLLRVVHLAAFLTGLLAQDGQSIIWITDNDEIAPTPEMHQKTLVLFERVLGIYARKGINFQELGGALPFKERDLKTLDLLSATDIVAGSLDQYLTELDSVSTEEVKVKAGADHVLQWLSHDGVGLKKMNIIMRPGADGNVEASALEFRLENPPQNATMIPIAI